MTSLRLAADRQFGDDHALPAQRVVEPAILLAIDNIDAAGDDRRGTRIDTTEMGRGIDTAGQPGNDDEPALTESGCEFTSETPAVGRGVARADDRYHRMIQQLDPSEHSQDRRRVFDRS
jgi:hypothetical protein